MRFGGKVSKKHNKAIPEAKDVFADFRRSEGRWPSNDEAKETAKNISLILGRKGKSVPSTVVLLTKYPNAPSWVSLGGEWINHALVLTPSPDAVPVFGRTSLKRPTWSVHGLNNAVAYASLAVNHASKKIVLMELQDASRSQRVPRALERFSVRHQQKGFEHALHVLAVSAIVLARKMHYDLYAVTPAHVQRVWGGLNPETAEGVYGGVVSSACRLLNLPDAKSVEAVRAIGERASSLRDSLLRRVYSSWEIRFKKTKPVRRRLTPAEEEKTVRRLLVWRKARDKAMAKARAENARRMREAIEAGAKDAVKRMQALKNKPRVLPDSRKRLESLNASEKELLRQRLKRVNRLPR